MKTYNCEGGVNRCVTALTSLPAGAYLSPDRLSSMFSWWQIRALGPAKGVTWYSVVVSCLVPLARGPPVKMQQACTVRERMTPANSLGATWAYDLKES